MTGPVSSSPPRRISGVGLLVALTVTFLQPVFAMLWAALFLSESITTIMLLGCGLVLAGTMLVTSSVQSRETQRAEAEAAASEMA